MTPPGPYGLSFCLAAVAELQALPRDIRDRAIRMFESVVNARITGTALAGDLREYRKLQLGEEREWRIVYRIQQAPPDFGSGLEVHVVAVRHRHDVYDTVRARADRPRPATGPRAHAARTLSPQMRQRDAQPAVPAVPAPAWRPADLFTTPDTDLKRTRR
ncbi:hypothetical protein AB0C52_24910 [Streptomyces sp. NPDC048717]|uniref:type II toxin-antitoxin system RelE family toxin n=1 Tax=Streptomyces sp. NPDC048717 TaxID=3154928 RepID=UPI00343A5F8A